MHYISLTVAFFCMFSGFAARASEPGRLAEPALPEKIAEWGFERFGSRLLAVQGNWLFFFHDRIDCRTVLFDDGEFVYENEVCDRAIVIVDGSDPINPKKFGELRIDNSSRLNWTVLRNAAVYIEGDYFYTEGAPTTRPPFALSVASFANPSDPKWVFSGEFEDLVQNADGVSRFSVHRNYLLAALPYVGLRVFSLRDPARPIFIIGVGDAVTFSQSNDFAVGSGGGVSTVFDLSDPALPKTLERFKTAEVIGLFGNIAVARTQTNSLQLLSFGDFKSAPVLLSEIPTDPDFQFGSNPRPFRIGNTVFVQLSAKSLSGFDIEVPDLGPFPVHTFGANLIRTFASGNLLFANTESNLTVLKTLSSSKISNRIVSTPVNSKFVLGDQIILRVSAEGAFPIEFTWTKDGLPLVDGDRVTGARSPVLKISNAEIADAGRYEVTVKASVGDPSIAVIEVTVVPLIAVPLAHSLSFTHVPAGSAPILPPPATKGVVAVSLRGRHPMSFQWFSKGVAIPGAVSAELTFSNANPAFSGEYSVQVKNPDGLVTSAPVALSIAQPLSPVKTTLLSTGVFDVAVRNNKVFAAGAFGLKVGEIDAASQFVELGSFASGMPATQVRAAGNLALLLTDRITILDVSVPNSVRPLAEIEATNAPNAQQPWFRFDANEQLLLFPGILKDRSLKNRLLVYDISNPAKPILAGEHVNLRPDGEIHALAAVALSGSTAVAAYNDNLTILDLSNPSAPQEHFRLEAALVQDVKFSRSHVWLSISRDVSFGAMCVLDLANPASPRWERPPALGEGFRLGITEDLVIRTSPGQYFGEPESFYDVFDSATGRARSLAGPRIPTIPAERIEQLTPRSVLAAGGEALKLVNFPEDPLYLAARRAPEGLQLFWTGGPTVKMQDADSPSGALWREVPGSQFTNDVTVPIRGFAKYFRLFRDK